MAAIHAATAPRISMPLNSRAHISIRCTKGHTARSARLTVLPAMNGPPLADTPASMHMSHAAKNAATSALPAPDATPQLLHELHLRQNKRNRSSQGCAVKYRT